MCVCVCLAFFSEKSTAYAQTKAFKHAEIYADGDVLGWDVFVEKQGQRIYLYVDIPKSTLIVFLFCFIITSTKIEVYKYHSKFKEVCVYLNIAFIFYVKVGKKCWYREGNISRRTLLKIFSAVAENNALLL